MNSPDPPRVVRPRPPARLPETVDRMLRSAHKAEQIARGVHRRAAFQLTRDLLGGSQRAGYPVHLLAECLGLSPKSLRARCGSDGWISADEIASLIGTSSDIVSRRLAGGRISSTVDAADGALLYLASDVIRSAATWPGESPS
jgi:hypothetical protein